MAVSVTKYLENKLGPLLDRWYDHELCMCSSILLVSVQHSHYEAIGNTWPKQSFISVTIFLLCSFLIAFNAGAWIAGAIVAGAFPFVSSLCVLAYGFGLRLACFVLIEFWMNFFLAALLAFYRDHPFFFFFSSVHRYFVFLLLSCLLFVISGMPLMLIT